MNYTGKICDGCRQPIEDGEDIVVCPECGTPQHRSCYEKNNKCVNEYLHSADFTWTAPEEETKEEDPSALQEAENREEPQMPIFPQSPIQSPQNLETVFMRGVLYDPKEDIGGAKVGEAASFFQNSAPRYVSKFMKQKKSGRKILWNWAAFFFNPFWFFYRKLYKAGSVFLALSVALALVTYSRTEKVYGVYEEMVSVQQEASELVRGKENLTQEENKKLDELADKAEVLALSSVRDIGLILAVQYLIPNIIAALVADWMLKRRMLKIIALSHGVSDEQNFVINTIISNGGVSVLMTVLAMVIKAYLPSLLLNIADKINF